MIRHLVTLLLCLCFGSVEARKGEFFFVQLTDTQLGMMTRNNGFEQESKLIAQTIEEINRIHPAFVVITGDLINQDGNEAQIAEFKRLTNAIQKEIQVYIVPGNHDVGLKGDPTQLAQYIDHFGSDRFSFTYGNCHFIGFNSPVVWARQWESEQEQLNWMEQQLERAKGKRCMVFAHHPLFVKSADEPDRYQNLPVERRQAYINLFNRYGVTHLFAGHLHGNNTASEGNLSVVATNAVCVTHSNEGPGVRVIWVKPEGVEHTYYTLDTLKQFNGNERKRTETGLRKPAVP